MAYYVEDSDEERESKRVKKFGEVEGILKVKSDDPSHYTNAHYTVLPAGDVNSQLRFVSDPIPSKKTRVVDNHRGNKKKDGAAYAVRNVQTVDDMTCLWVPPDMRTPIKLQIIDTEVAGLDQEKHYDLCPRLATKYFLFVCIKNLSETEDCFVNIGDKEVRVAPGWSVHFSANTVHSGSGKKHSSRLYFLYSKLALTPEEVAMCYKSAEVLCFWTEKVPDYPCLPYQPSFETRPDYL